MRYKVGDWIRRTKGRRLSGQIISATGDTYGVQWFLPTSPGVGIQLYTERNLEDIFEPIILCPHQRP